MTGTPQPYRTSMSWQQLVAALQTDIAALYTAAGAAGTVTSIGLTPGSSDIVVGSPNPVTGAGSIPIDLSSAVKSELGLAGTALQPVTGLTGDYTYASLTLNSLGQITAIGNGTAPPAAANPTGKVGTTAVNGSASTFMRSDAAPPIDLTASFAWTGAHTFSQLIKVEGNPVDASQVNTQTGTTYTFAITDVMLVVYATNTSAKTFTVNTGIFTPGQKVYIINGGSGTLTIAAGSGVTLVLSGTGTSGNRTMAGNAVGTLRCIGSSAIFLLDGPGVT